MQEMEENKESNKTSSPSPILISSQAHIPLPTHSQHLTDQPRPLFPDQINHWATHLTDAALDAEIALRHIDLAWTNGLLGPSSLASGEAFADISASGPITNPAISGNLTLRDVELAGIAGVQPITDLQLDSQFNLEQITIDTLAMQYGQGGLSLTGIIPIPQQEVSPTRTHTSTHANKQTTTTQPDQAPPRFDLNLNASNLPWLMKPTPALLVTSQ